MLFFDLQNQEKLVYCLDKWRIEMHKTQKGFTLAEVLITLAIIGVVAALTIPSVVRNYQKQQYYTGFMKAYNSLSRAFNSSIAQNGPVATWNIPTQDNEDFENFINDYFVPYLKIQKKCIGTNNECFAQNYLSLDGSTSFITKPNDYKCKYILTDGFSISFMPKENTKIVHYQNNGDINGLQKQTSGQRLIYFYNNHASWDNRTLCTILEKRDKPIYAIRQCKTLLQKRCCNGISI
jgi:prepilin-type N-terminal cleavage/methylation domain-containing protein